MLTTLLIVKDFAFGKIRLYYRGVCKGFTELLDEEQTFEDFTTVRVNPEHRFYRVEHDFRWKWVLPELQKAKELFKN